MENNTITMAMNPMVHNAWLLPTASGSSVAVSAAVTACIAVDVRVRAFAAAAPFGPALRGLVTIERTGVPAIVAAAKHATSTGHPAWNPPI